MAHFFKKKFARSKSIWKKYSSMNTSAYFPSRRSASREAVAIRAKISAATIHKRGNVILDATTRKPTCRCQPDCPDTLATVCASNGKTVNAGDGRDFATLENFKFSSIFWMFNKKVLGKNINLLWQIYFCYSQIVIVSNDQIF